MGFDWDAIREQESSEMAFYRLLGEMLRQRATRADLDRVRGFLGAVRPSLDAWHSLGEALFLTTGGSSDGYAIWTGWARAMEGDAYDESHQLAAWQRFRRDFSESLVLDSEAGLAESTDADGEPPTIQFDAPDLESDESTRVLEQHATVRRGLVEGPATDLLGRMPTGPHTVRFGDRVYDDVEPLMLVGLLRRGVFFGLEFLLAGRWVAVEDHPAFRMLVSELARDAHEALAMAELEVPEVTKRGVAP